MIILKSANAVDSLLKENKDITPNNRVSNSQSRRARIATKDCPGGGSMIIDDSSETVEFRGCINDGVELTGYLNYINDSKVELINFYAKSKELETYYSKVTFVNELDYQHIYIKTSYIKSKDDYIEVADYSLKRENDKSYISGYYATKKHLNGKWIKIDTKNAIINDGECPKGGILEISANSNIIKIEYKSNHNVKLYFNDKLINTYKNCQYFQDEINLFTNDRAKIDIKKDKLLSINVDNIDKTVAIANILYRDELRFGLVKTPFESTGRFLYSAIQNCYGKVLTANLYVLKSCEYGDSIINGRVVLRFSNIDNIFDQTLQVKAIDLNISKSSNDYIFYKNLVYKDSAEENAIEKLNSEGIIKANGLSMKFITDIDNKNKYISIAPECLGFNWYDVKPYIDESEITINFKYIGDNDTLGYYSIRDDGGYIIFNDERVKVFDYLDDDTNEYFNKILKECNN